MMAVGSIMALLLYSLLRVFVWVCMLVNPLYPCSVCASGSLQLLQSLTSANFACHSLGLGGTAVGSSVWSLSLHPSGHFCFTYQAVTLPLSPYMAFTYAPDFVVSNLRNACVDRCVSTEEKL